MFGPRYCEHPRFPGYRQGLAVREKLAADFPTVARYRWDLAAAYKNTGETIKALVEMTKAVDLEPNRAAGWNLRGIAFFESGQFDKAVADYTKCIELQSSEAVFWSNRASAQNRLAQWDKAVADATKALALRPNYWHALNSRGHAYAGLGQWQEAAVDFAKAALRKKDDPLLRNHQALALFVILCRVGATEMTRENRRSQ